MLSEKLQYLLFTTVSVTIYEVLYGKDVVISLSKPAVSDSTPSRQKASVQSSEGYTTETVYSPPGLALVANRGTEGRPQTSLDSWLSHKPPVKPSQTLEANVLTLKQPHSAVPKPLFAEKPQIQPDELENTPSSSQGRLGKQVVIDLPAKRLGPSLLPDKKDLPSPALPEQKYLLRLPGEGDPRLKARTAAEEPGRTLGPYKLTTLKTPHSFVKDARVETCESLLLTGLERRRKGFTGQVPENPLDNDKL